MNTTRFKNGVWIILILLFALLFVFATHPFLRIPYDPWEHLIKIRSIFDTGSCFLYWPESKSSFCSWHWTWATLFSFINISDTLLWASIIHYAQFIFALTCLGYFSYTVIRLCDKKAQAGHVFLASCFATLFWLVGNGTYSVDYQQAWIMWYSVTYQGATIPLFWLITGFTLNLFFNNDLRPAQKPTYCVLIVFGFLTIAFFHPSEAVYYLIFLILSLFLSPHFSLVKKFIFGILILILVPSVLYSIASYLHLPFFHGVTLSDGLLSLVEHISDTGEKIVGGGENRLQSTLSELAMVSLFAAAGYWLISLLVFRKSPAGIVSVISVALVIFFLIPTNKWFAGLTGVLLHQNIVWRFFYASPWFLFLPLIFFKIARQLEYAKVSMFIGLTTTLLMTYLGSQFYFNKTLYNNVRSLNNSFIKERVGVQYSAETFEYLKQIIAKETGEQKRERVMLYLRGDMATLARGIYGYYAYTHRRVSIAMRQFFSSGMDKKYALVPVDLPLGFPRDRNIFIRFDLDTKRISKRQDLPLAGEHPALFNLEKVDMGSTYLFIRGWAILKGQPDESIVSVVLQSDQETAIYNTSLLFRWDVGKRFKSVLLENTGFLATIRISELKPGSHRIGLLIKQGGQQGYELSDKSIVVPAADNQ